MGYVLDLFSPPRFPKLIAMINTYRALSLMLLLPLGALSGCSSPYGPHSWRGGYTDSRLSDTRFAIRFEGNGLTKPDQVEDMWLRRAADVASANGYEFFVIEGSREAANIQSFKGTEGTYKATTTLRPDGLGGAVADTSGTYSAPTTSTVTRHSKSGVIVGYKDGTQPANAFKASLILDKYK